MSVPQLVIFDCDGVLVDSEVIACKTVSTCLDEIGINVSVEEVIRFYAGVSSKTMLDDLRHRFGDTIRSDFAEIVRLRTMEALTRELKAMDGVKVALRSIPIRTCVASSSTRERIIQSLTVAGLRSFFDVDVLFSATQVPRGKPAPDLFLFAAEQMAVRPDDCVVIEDSARGVQGARAAGMRVLGFTGGSHCGPGHGRRLEEAGALTTFQRMRELPARLAALR
jgi:HAD superfamily hydrolase (TIGR01509 family)